MANRCLNKIMLLGNLTKDPELRYTPQGVAVCSFGIATNRRWTTQDGEQKEAAQFHNVVAWNKLAELCSQLLVKGSRTYVEGRLQYREWEGEDGKRNRRSEIVIEDMILLTPRSGNSQGDEEAEGGEMQSEPKETKSNKESSDDEIRTKEDEENEENNEDEERPF